MHTNRPLTAAALISCWMLPLGALGQPGEPAAKVEAKAPTPTMDWPKPAVTSTDAQITAAVRALTGSFRAPARGESPGIDLHTAVVNIPGLDNALYFELTRSDSPQAAFQSGLLTFVKSSGGVGVDGLRLRVLKFAGLPATFMQAVTGLYLAPEAFPPLALENLSVLAEIPLKAEGEAFAGTATGVPVYAGGAVYMTTSVRFDGTTVRWSDRGTDAAGKLVWGPATEAEAPVFARFAPTSKVERKDSRLIVIDLVSAPADAPVSVQGSFLALHYTGWLLADGSKFDSSLDPNRRPIETVVPLTLIEGWNQGIPGIQQGTTRRLIIPGALGYGDRGNPRARIPANAALVFEVSCVFHRLPEAKPAPAPGTPDAPIPATPIQPMGEGAGAPKR